MQLSIRPQRPCSRARAVFIIAGKGGQGDEGEKSGKDEKRVVDPLCICIKFAIIRKCNRDI